MNSKVTAESHSRWTAGSQTLILRWIARFRLSPTDADDVIQEAQIEWMVRLHQSGATEAPEELAAWFRQVVRSKVLKLLRFRRRHSAIPWDDVLGTTQELFFWAEDPTAATDQQTKMDRLQAAVANLGDGLNARVLRMHYFAGMAIVKIAEATGLTPGNVRDRLWRTRAKLRKKLEG